MNFNWNIIIHNDCLYCSHWKRCEYKKGLLFICKNTQSSYKHLCCWMKKINCACFSKLQLHLLFQNSPLFISCANPDLELQFQYRVHTALDIVEEKLLNIASSEIRKLYLGLLHSTEVHKMYPFLFLMYNYTHFWLNFFLTN